MNFMIPANYIPLWTLYTKEVMRFLKVGMQTIIGPAISSILFLAVFSLALVKSVETISNVPFSEFIAPGLIMMTILQNSLYCKEAPPISTPCTPLIESISFELDESTLPP